MYKTIYEHSEENTMSIYDKTGHIDQLTEWWENAAQIAPMRGDLVIEDVTDEDGPDYRIRKWPGDMREKLSYVRVLEPKPKPTWHDAVAVVASAELFPDERRVMVKCSETIIGRGPKVIYWEDSSSGAEWRSEDLRDVTPLIEAKVTEEMITKVREVLDEAGWTIDDMNFGDGNPTLIKALSAALGIEESSV